jgi:hypothetical protein
MNFEDALRKVISESREDLLTFSQRASFDFYDLLNFINKNQRLGSKTKIEKLRDNLNNEDYQKLLLLLNR